MSGMNAMNDIHALSGAYAVDALDDTERAEFEAHLPGCADCRAEVASFRETAALLAETTAEAPPGSLRDGVLAGIREVRPLPPEADKATGVTHLGVRRRRLFQGLVAAAAVVLLAVGVVLWHPWSNQSTSEVDQVLNAPDAVKVTQKLPGGAGTLTLVRSPSLKRAVMIGEDVPEPPAGKTYQLWYQQPGEGFVSAGLMPDSHEPTVLTGDAATATAAALSVEPATGSRKPTLPPVALFPFSNTGEGST
jgi:anti-sigma-K factor RskA